MLTTERWSTLKRDNQHPKHIPQAIYPPNTRTKEPNPSRPQKQRKKKPANLLSTAPKDPGRKPNLGRFKRSDAMRCGAVRCSAVRRIQAPLSDPFCFFSSCHDLNAPRTYFSLFLFFKISSVVRVAVVVVLRVRVG